MTKTQNTFSCEHRFSSPSEFVEEIRSSRVRVDIHRPWTGDYTLSEIYDRMAHGDEKHVPAAEKAIEEITRGLRLETLKTEWRPDMCGAFADVPSFLAGDPACMRRKFIVSREVAPMRLYACMSSSAGVSTTVLTERGICLLGLVMALTRVRAVELWTFNAGERGMGRYQEVTDLVRMPTSPIDLGLIAFCMIDQGYTRGLCYGYIEHHEPGILATPPMTNMERLRGLVGAQDDDVVFPPIHLYDDYKNPTKWVKDRLAEILKLNEEQIEALT